MKYVREPGGFYYAEDEYGHREPVNMSLGTEAVDGIIEGFPIAFRIVVGLTKLIYTVFAKIRNIVMLEEDAERFRNLDSKVRVDFGSGFIGGFITVLALTLLWDIAVVEIVYSLVKSIIKPVMNLIKKNS